MVSRRKFFSMFLMMAVLLFMFQFSEIIKENGNNYDKNEYAGKVFSSKEDKWTEEGSNKHSLEGDLDKTDDILFIGDEKGSMANVISQWCTYSKRRYSTDTSFKNLGEKKYDVILLDTNVIDILEEFPLIKEVLGEGTPIIFCTLPDAELIRENIALRELFGIATIKTANVALEGVQVYDGFLLGGEAVYKAQNEKDAEKFQDLDIEVPWYILGPGTKAYVSGILDEDKYKSEDFPRIVWRSYYHGTMIFAISGDYMSDLTGLGLLNSFMYEMQDYSIYPVVNAQNTVLVDYPGLSNENSEEIYKIYSRTPQALFMDIMWPGILSMATKDDLKLTCYINTKYNYDDGAPVTDDNLVFYLQQLKEVDAEAGKSLNFKGNITIEDKIKSDNEFYKKTKLNYKFGTLFTDDLKKVPEELFENEEFLKNNWSISTPYTEENPLFGYYGDSAVLQSVTNIADEYSYSRDLMARSLKSALGYSSTMISIGNVMWPESKDDQWQIYFDEVFSNVTTYWKGSESFDITTVSECDERVRGLLNVEYDSVKKGDTLYLSLEGAAEVWFILRTHGEDIKDMKGGSFKEIEEDAYLIHTSSRTVEIKLEESEDILGYKGPFGN